MWRDVRTAGRTRRPQVVLAPLEHSGFDDGERCGVRGSRTQVGKGRATAGRGSRLSDAEGARRLRPFGKGRAARESGDRGLELEGMSRFVISHPKGGARPTLSLRTAHAECRLQPVNYSIASCG